MTRPSRRTRRRRPFRLLVVNVYARNRVPWLVKAVLVARRPHAVIATEAHRLGAVPGYRRLSGDGPRGGEVAIYVRRDKPVSHWCTEPITKEGRGYAHERHLTDAVVGHARLGWTLIGLHANPPSARYPEAREGNVKLLKTVEQDVEDHEADGGVPIVGGDWNRGPHDRSPDAPGGLAQRLGYRISIDGIDGIIHPPTVNVVRRRRFRVPGSNHPGLAYHLTATAPASYADRMDDLR